MINDFLFGVFQKNILLSICIIVFYLIVRIIRKTYSSQSIYLIYSFLLLAMVLPYEVLIREKISPVINIIDYSVSSTSVTLSAYEGYSFSVNHSLIFVSTWILVAIIIGFFKIVQYSLFIKHVEEHGVELTNYQALEICSDLKIQPHRIKVLINKGLESSFTYGLIHPVVVVPSITTDRLIIEHELNHIRRKDQLIKILSQICVSVYWFNPLVYLLVKELNIYCELSCDEKVLQNYNHDSRMNYFHLLMKSYTSSKSGSYAMSSSFMDLRSVKLRLSAILHSPKKAVSKSMITIFVAFLITLTTFIGCKQEDTFDPTINSTYNEPIMMTYDSFSEVEAILTEEKEFTIDIEGYEYSGNYVFHRAERDEETKKWVVEFRGALSKKE